MDSERSEDGFRVAISGFEGRSGGCGGGLVVAGEAEGHK